MRDIAEVRKLLVNLLHEIAAIPPETIADTSCIDDDLRMESVAFVELQVAIEDELNIRLDPIQIVELNRFDAIVDYVYQTAVEAAA
jgi:acyl carrier protein